MDKDGLYLLCGPDNRVLGLIVEDNRRVVWLRYFATKESALDILEDDVLSDYERTAVLSQLRNGGFYTDSYEIPEGGLRDVAFLRYDLRQ